MGVGNRDILGEYARVEARSGAKTEAGKLRCQCLAGMRPTLMQSVYPDSLRFDRGPTNLSS